MCSVFIFSKQRVWMKVQNTRLEEDSAKCACILYLTSAKWCGLHTNGKKMTGLLSSRVIQLDEFPQFCSVTVLQDFERSSWCWGKRSGPQLLPVCYILSWRKKFPQPQLFPRVSKTLKCNARAILFSGTEPPGFQQLSPASRLWSMIAILGRYSSFPSASVLMCLCTTAFLTAPRVEQAALLSLSPFFP